MSNALVWDEFEELTAERVAMPGRQVREGHFVGPADLGLDLVDLAGESMRRHPLGHRIAIEERSVNPLGWGTKYAVKFDGVFSHGALLLVVRAAVAATGSQLTLTSVPATNEATLDRPRR